MTHTQRRSIHLVDCVHRKSVIKKMVLIRRQILDIRPSSPPHAQGSSFKMLNEMTHIKDGVTTQFHLPSMLARKREREILVASIQTQQGHVFDVSRSLVCVSFTKPWRRENLFFPVHTDHCKNHTLAVGGLKRWIYDSDPPHPTINVCQTKIYLKWTTP